MELFERCKNRISSGVYMTMFKELLMKASENGILAQIIDPMRIDLKRMIATDLNVDI